MMFLPDFSSIGQIIAIIGAGLIAVFGGRKVRTFLENSWGILGFIISPIYEWYLILFKNLSINLIFSGNRFSYEHVSRYGSRLTDRFFFSILIYIVGHVFNLAMGLLSAYVHDSRLQYIEFFGKFYEGGGYEFKPLTLNLKYINEINDNSKLKGEN